MIIGKSLTALVSGGLVPMIIVTAPTGSTVKLDGVAGTEVSGTWTFNNISMGSHTVVAISQDTTETRTRILNVDAIGIYTITLSYIVPSAYQAVEYLQCTGTQAIQTNLFWNTPYGVIVDCQFLEFETNRWICGAWNYASWIIGMDNATTLIAMCNPDTSAAHLEVALDDDRHTLGWDMTNYYYDGATVSGIAPAFGFSGSAELRLFDRGAYTGYIPASARIYGAYFTDSNDAKVRDYVPCYCLEQVTGYKGATSVTVPSGTAGLYDLVNDRFYVNSNSGADFILGDDV